jgi:hypothetical protein
MAVFDNYANAVVSTLQARGLSGDCPMCKKNAWVVHEVPISLPVYEASGQVQYPGTSMPMAAMICRNCGWSGLFSLGALGLINQNKAPQAGQTAQPGQTMAPVAAAEQAK